MDYPFKAGDRVRIRYFDGYAYGEITIVRDEREECKVIWDGDYDLDYDYYPMSQLELVRSA